MKYKWLETTIIELPQGWKEIFRTFCEEVDKWYQKQTQEVKDDFRAIVIKEKYGDFIPYFNKQYEKIQKIVDKYVATARRTCAYCGARANYVATGYIEPVCEPCSHRRHIDCVKIESSPE